MPAEARRCYGGLLEEVSVAQRRECVWMNCPTNRWREGSEWEIKSSKTGKTILREQNEGRKRHGGHKDLRI